MLSFFSRYTNPNKNTYYNSNLSKYVFDTTNKVKESHTKLKTNTNAITIQEPYEILKCNCDFSIVPLFSMISFLAGYYLSKYNN